MIAVIGDIHGCFFTLKELVKKIREKYSDIELYSVGDLVDRGNFSYEVVEFIIKEKIKFTPGNHDYMFMYFVEEPGSVLGNAWIYNGSEKTIASYKERSEKIPEHIDVIKKAPLFFNLEDCFISHAGISSYYKSKLPKNYKENLDQLDKIANYDIAGEHGILWTRDELVNIGKLQIVGHTRMEEITFDKKNNVVYIDTSVYTGNMLTTVIVKNNQIFDTISINTFSKDIE